MQALGSLSALSAVASMEIEVAIPIPIAAGEKMPLRAQNELTEINKPKGISVDRVNVLKGVDSTYQMETV